MIEKKKKDLYFGKEVDDAILEYLNEPNSTNQSKIFEHKIMPAFEKLAQYHYHKFPVARNEEIIKDCVVFLYEQLKKFNVNKSIRGFPYFNIIARNFFIQKMKLEKKELIQEQDFMISLNDPESASALLTEDLEENIEEKQFIEIFKKQLPLWRDKFTKTHEKQIVDAIILLFEQVDAIDLFKKKAIFFYLKEMTGLNSKQIAINLGKIKKKFLFLRERYDRGDF